MAVYLLSYDLLKEQDSHDYKPLWNALEKAGAHRALYSEWLISSTLTAKGLHDKFKTLLDDDDRLFVSRIRKGEYWYSNAKGGTNDWMNNNLG